MAAKGARHGGEVQVNSGDGAHAARARRRCLIRAAGSRQHRRDGPRDGEHGRRRAAPHPPGRVRPDRRRSERTWASPGDAGAQRALRQRLLKWHRGRGCSHRGASCDEINVDAKRYRDQPDDQADEESFHWCLLGLKVAVYTSPWDCGRLGTIYGVWLAPGDWKKRNAARTGRRRSIKIQDKIRSDQIRLSDGLRENLHPNCRGIQNCRAIRNSRESLRRSPSYARTAPNSCGHTIRRTARCNHDTRRSRRHRRDGLSSYRGSGRTGSRGEPA